MHLSKHLKRASRHLLRVHSLRERSKGVQTFINRQFFHFSLPHVRCVSIPVWLLVFVLTCLLLSHSLQPILRVEMKHPPLSCELHKHKSEEDKDRIPGGPAAIAAPAHIATILTYNCSCVVPVEKADLSEIGLLLWIENVSRANRKI